MTQKTMDIITFGDACVDMVITGSDVAPQFGQAEKLVEGYSLLMGGSTTIFASQAAKLGARAAVVGRVGPDAFGDIIRGALENSGVCTEYLTTDPNEKTGVTVILNEVSDRAMLTYLGTIGTVSLADAPEELLARARHLHIGSYFLLSQLREGLPAFVRRFKAGGGTMSLDTNWDPEEKWSGGLEELLPLADVFLPNENELLAIAGRETLEEALSALPNIPVIAVKMGEKGAMVRSNGQIFRAEALPVTVADTVGAGDSFDAGFLCAWLRGLDPSVCARYGAICGSMSARFHGGTAGQPSLGELEALL